mmetsp:Transcript_9500/g.14670  ORF Transcript_9500/g.14670 Transcript_9500/m.14670 type:complete len:387 (+) Transcript_9500:111-1271(+)
MLKIRSFFSSFLLLFISQSVADASSPMRVTIVGGTHGNEYTGVWCIKSLDRRLSSSESTSTNNNNNNNPKKLYPHLEISTLLGNPQAHQENKRFVDEDLNRQFSYKALVEEFSSSLESKRAREINQLLGPKNFDEKNCNSDATKTTSDVVIIDLHTTTTNMGVTLIVGEGDPLMTRCAAYIVQKLRSSDDNRVSVLMHTHKDQKSRPNVASIVPHGLSIEVGPVPQGVIRHDVVEKTQQALEAALEFLERTQQQQQQQQTHPDELEKELRQSFPNGQVPCYRSAPAKRAGEMSSKIPWPCDSQNLNFPAWMVHKSVQDADFQEIEKGDPLFVDLDGKVIPYDGSHGSPVLLMFINEGGYYYSSSGTGISVAVRDKYSLETGKLIVE